MIKKTIGVFTGNRAEYGLLVPVIRLIQQSSNVSLCLIVGGDHWLTGTVSEIETDGFPITMGLQPSADFQSRLYASLSPAQQMALVSAQIMDAFSSALTCQPLDALIILGDRYESMAAALTACYVDCPVFHIGGGDITEGGCVDDTLRDVITRLARWHAVSCQTSYDRLLSLGVAADAIQMTGSLVVDNIATLDLIPKPVLLNQFDISSSQPIVLFTQHPIPAEGLNTVQHFQESLQALAELPVTVVATYPNRDGFDAEMQDAIKTSKSLHPNIRWTANLGRHRYLSWMAACDVVAGNTSSGLVETPFFKKPSLTIGPRQAGRFRAENVRHCDYGVETVKTALVQILNNTEWCHQLDNLVNPYGQQPAAPLILKMLTNSLAC